MITGSNLQLKQTVLSYGANFFKKYFRSKTEKITITTAFFIFGLVILPIFSSN